MKPVAAAWSVLAVAAAVIAALAGAAHSQPAANPYANRTFVGLGVEGASGRSTAWFVDTTNARVIHCTAVGGGAPACSASAIP